MCGRKWVTDILLDTGCFWTLVQRELIPDHKILEGKVTTIQCAHRDMVLYPLADMELQVAGKCITVEAAVSETLPMSVLLGTDVPHLDELLRDTSGADQALAVVTRTQARRQQEKRWVEEQKRVTSGVHPGTLAGNRDNREMREGDARRWKMDRRTSSWSLQINSLLEARRAETEKRERRHKRWEEARQEAPEQEPRPQGLAEQLRKLQEKDPTLEQTWKAARREPSTGSAGFLVREGLLYRTWTTPRQGEEATVKQLVLPQECRKAVLHLAHHIPMAGHMRQEKTARRVLQRQRVSMVQ